MSNQLLPKKIEAFAGRRVVAVSAGQRHSFTVTTDGYVWSWGLFVDKVAPELLLLDYAAEPAHRG